MSENSKQLDLEIVNRAVALFEEIREIHGVIVYSKKTIYLDLPLERQFACESPDYREILTVPQSYILDYSCSRLSKFVYLHENGNIYYVYDNENSMWVDLLYEHEYTDTPHRNDVIPPLIPLELVTVMKSV
jgi:hypothetical protein